MQNRKSPIAVSVALTGARYASRKSDGETTATHMPLSPAENLRDSMDCAEAGAPYQHFHARNEVTGEQYANPDWYSALAHRFRSMLPKGILSFGSSRKGREVTDAIERFGEPARSVGLLAQPDAFTNFADVELAAFEREGYQCCGGTLDRDFIRDYYVNSCMAIHSLEILQEVEITTYPKSFDVLERLLDATPTRFLNPLHIVVLLGFSTALPISRPMFETAVARAKHLVGRTGGFVSVGAVIRPAESLKIDCATVMNWCLKDDRVSMFRTGIEDCPALSGVQTTNSGLVCHCVNFFQTQGCEILTDGNDLRFELGLPKVNRVSLADISPIRTLFQSFLNETVTKC